MADSTVEIDLSKKPSFDINLDTLGTITSDICLRTGKGVFSFGHSGRFFVKSGTMVSVLAVVHLIVSWLSFFFGFRGGVSTLVFSGCKAFALWDLRTPSTLVVGTRRFSVEVWSRLESWQALADFWTSLSRNGLFLKSKRENRIFSCNHAIYKSKKCRHLILIAVYLIFTPTGISGGRRLSAVGDRQAGEEAPLLAPDV